MRAQVLKKQAPLYLHSLSLEDVPIPLPHQGQVRIKVTACGFCLTDRHIIEGDIPAKKIPLIPGHQIVGIIDAVGSNVTGFKKGDKVGVFWLHQTCNTCNFCQSGLENLCDRATFTGYDVDGGYAEYTLAEANYLVSLPKHYTDVEVAPFLCAGIVGFRSYKLANIPKKGKLALFGFGAAANLTIQVANYYECETSVFTRSENHQLAAKRLGARWVGTIDDEPPTLFDSAIIFAPSGELVPRALKWLKKGGTLAINAIHTSDIPSFPYDLIYHEKIVKSVANATRQDASEFLSLIERAKLKTTTSIFPLEEANQALLKHKASEIEASIVFST